MTKVEIIIDIKEIEEFNCKCIETVYEINCEADLPLSLSEFENGIYNPNLLYELRVIEDWNFNNGYNVSIIYEPTSIKLLENQKNLIKIDSKLEKSIIEKLLAVRVKSAQHIP